MVKHPDVHLIAFTGSREVGCRIYADAAIVQPGQKHLKRVIAEMGGKNAIIVDDSADLDQAVVGTVKSAFGYTGQKCSACSRVIVLDSVYDAFLARFVEATRSLNIGDAAQPSTEVGPVIDATAQARIKEYIETGKQEAEIALEMPTPPTGYFVSPTIFKNVPATATIAQEEIFGPVLTIYTYPAAQFEKTLKVLDSTSKYALTGSIISQDRASIELATNVLRHSAGNFYINDKPTGAVVGQQPFGGARGSGTNDKAGSALNLYRWLSARTIKETFNPPTDYKYPFLNEA
jgi:RHH-type proline utilization regulon transcriptional repressor/proline dehydrogenase/delta 1-pyrroline-5-carboxylate dehydrogenase